MVEEVLFFVVDENFCVKMGKVVVLVVKVVDYIGVGMVEFLLDKYGYFYFMEMNIWI